MLRFIPSRRLLLVMMLIAAAGVAMASVSVPAQADTAAAGEDKAAGPKHNKPVQPPAKRIVALAPHIVELLYAIGAGDTIVGTTEYADYPEAAKTIPRIGSYAGVQVERVLELQPDLVLAWKTGNSVADLARIEEYGLRVVYSDLKHMKDVGDEIRMLGELTGHQQAAEREAAQYEQHLAEIKARYAGKRRVKGFYELWSRPLTTVAANAWPQQQLEICGVDNPFAGGVDDYPQVGLEQVLVTMPEVIIQPDQHSRASPDAVDWGVWPLIPAVKMGAIFHPDSDKSHRMTPRTLDEMEILCEEVDQVRQQLQ